MITISLSGIGNPITCTFGTARKLSTKGAKVVNQGFSIFEQALKDNPQNADPAKPKVMWSADHPTTNATGNALYLVQGEKIIAMIIYTYGTMDKDWNTVGYFEQDRLGPNLPETARVQGRTREGAKAVQRYQSLRDQVRQIRESRSSDTLKDIFAGTASG